MKLEIVSFRARGRGGRTETVCKTAELFDALELFFEIVGLFAAFASDPPSGETLTAHPTQDLRFAVRHPRESTSESGRARHLLFAR